MKTIWDLKHDWRSLVDNLPDPLNKTNAAALLRPSYTGPESIEGNTILLKCRYSIHAENLNKPESKRIVEEILSRYMDVPFLEVIIEQGEVTLTSEEVQLQLEKEGEEKARREAQEEESRKIRHQNKMKGLIHYSNIPRSALDSMRFDTYEAKTDIQKRALATAQEFCDYPKDDSEEELSRVIDYRWSILFHGPCGTGKTHLAVAIARVKLLELERTVIFWKVPELLLELRKGFDNGSYNETIQEVKNADVLILDDWGMHKATDWADEQLDAIMDFRYSRFEDWFNATIVTTNLSFKDLQPRVRSRLGEGFTVSLTGDDYRLLKGAGKIKTDKAKKG